MQLRFDGDNVTRGPVVLNCYVWPAIDDGGRTWQENELGYADAIRKLLPGTVNAATDQTGSGIRITLDTGTVILHPTREEVFVEIAEISGFDDRAWNVWLPGRDTFEDVV